MVSLIVDDAGYCGSKAAAGRFACCYAAVYPYCVRLVVSDCVDADSCKKLLVIIVGSKNVCGLCCIGLWVNNCISPAITVVLVIIVICIGGGGKEAAMRRQRMVYTFQNFLWSNCRPSR